MRHQFNLNRILVYFEKDFSKTLSKTEKESIINDVYSIFYNTMVIQGHSFVLRDDKDLKKEKNQNLDSYIFSAFNVDPTQNTILIGKDFPGAIAKLRTLSKKDFELAYINSNFPKYTEHIKIVKPFAEIVRYKVKDGTDDDIHEGFMNINTDGIIEFLADKNIGKVIGIERIQTEVDKLALDNLININDSKININ